MFHKKIVAASYYLTTLKAISKTMPTTRILHQDTNIAQSGRAGSWFFTWRK